MKIRINYFLFPIIFLCTMSGRSQADRDLLSALISESKISPEHFEYEALSKEQIQVGLTKLPDSIRVKLIHKGEEAREYSWPSIPLTSYMDFERKGDVGAMQDYYEKRNAVLKNLILAELIEDEGRFLDAIINACWAISEQSTWVLSAHLVLQDGGAGVPNLDDMVIDLGAGEIAAGLGWAYYLFKDDFENISPFLKERIPREIKRRVIEPYLDRTDLWWMGFRGGRVNNWNPWVNYNVLLSTVLISETLRSDVKAELVKKNMRSVDKFINYYKEDGATEEGPNYWGHAGGKLLEYLELLKKISNGQISLENEQIIKNIGKFIMNIHISDNYYVNFADSSVRVDPDPGLLYRYGLYVNDSSLMKFASYVADRGDFFENPAQGSLGKSFSNILLYQEIKATAGDKVNKLSHWFSETEIVTGRTNKEDKKGFFFAAKGGYNDESHNHNDVGSFILYHEGEPLLVDIGVETYTKKTFSNERYEIWTMQSNYHNLPEINGISQAHGWNYKASETEFKDEGSKLNFNLDISKAYPDEAEVDYWNRSYTLRRNNSALFIKDDFRLKKTINKNSIYFIAALPPAQLETGEIKLKINKDKEVSLFYPADEFEVVIEKLKLEDKKLLKAWKGKSLYRIVLNAKNKQMANEWVYKIVEREVGN